MRVPIRRSEKDALIKVDPHITQEMYDDLKNNLERLKKVTRFKLMKEVATLAEMGDLSENAAYQISKGKLRGINQRILDIEAQLKRAIIIKNKPGSTTVRLGSTVTVEINGKEKRYLLLGSSEVNPLNNIISHNSPLGTVLMGKKINETFSVPLKDRVLKGKIISIT